VPPTDFSLDGKIALITGASRGIGEAIAAALAALGAHCVLTSRKREGVDAAAARIVGKGYKADAIACHAGDMGQIDELAMEIERRFGKLDILVNNAGTNPHSGTMSSVTEALWDKTFEVNVKGVFFLSQRVVPMMVRAGGGVIINIASIEGIRPGTDRAIYSMTKAALISMTRSLARELAASNIRVNAILPGLIATQMSRTLMDDPEMYAQIVGTIPMQRHATPEEVANAALFLATDASSYTTGALLPVDGGVLA
jgi:NAD(P)-dependent dehydrogenase (short-subunit alcohol dehydrogenase family)